MVEHPMQPIVLDERGTARFVENAIVVYLLDQGGLDMNKLAVLPFKKKDREHFAQLIGYSVDGFEELSYVRNGVARKARRRVKQLTREKK